jgi:hypothetical protein
MARNDDLDPTPKYSTDLDFIPRGICFEDHKHYPIEEVGRVLKWSSRKKAREQLERVPHHVRGNNILFKGKVLNEYLDGKYD